MWETGNAFRRVAGHRAGLGLSRLGVFTTVCLACTVIARQSHRRDEGGLGSEWHRDEEDLCGCGCWGVGVLDRLERGVVRNRGRTGQDRGILQEARSVCARPPAERTGGRTHPHTPAPSLDLSGPPARTQPTSPPHLAYLRWEIWASWGPCKAVSSGNLSVIGLAVCVPIWERMGGGGVGEECCEKQSPEHKHFSLSVWWDSRVASRKGIEARHTSWCKC